MEPVAGNQRAQRQNDRDIDDICAENVADRHRRLLFDDGRNGRHKLWKRGADGDHRDRNDALGYAEHLGKNRPVVNEQIRAHHKTCRAEDKQRKVFQERLAALIHHSGSVGMLLNRKLFRAADIFDDECHEQRQHDQALRQTQHAVAA